MKLKVFLTILVLFISFPIFASTETPGISKFISILNTNIEVNIEGLSLPTEEAIMQNIQQNIQQNLQENLPIPVTEFSNVISNLQEFSGITATVNLTEVATGVLQGEVVTNQKLFGLIDVQIPYQITYDSINGQITQKITNDLWSYILDILSF